MPASVPVCAGLHTRGMTLRARGILLDGDLGCLADLLDAPYDKVIREDAEFTIIQNTGKRGRARGRARSRFSGLVVRRAPTFEPLLEAAAQIVAGKVRKHPRSARRDRPNVHLAAAIPVEPRIGVLLGEDRRRWRAPEPAEQPSKELHEAGLPPRSLRCHLVPAGPAEAED
jgi:hypothetical protein